MLDTPKLRRAYLLPERLRALIAENRRTFLVELRRRCDDVSKMDDFAYAQHQSIAVFGQVAEALCGEAACTLNIRPDKSTGAWLLEFRSGERWIYDEQVNAAFGYQRQAEADALPRVTVVEGDESYCEGPGWYYYDAEYPDEGVCGAFTTKAAATHHAEKAGYRVDP